MRCDDCGRHNPDPFEPCPSCGFQPSPVEKQERDESEAAARDGRERVDALQATLRALRERNKK